MPEVELQIDRLSQLGEGVASFDGRSVFLWGAFPGERVRARVEPSGKVLRGEVLEVLRASPSREAAACPLSERCGGCDWMGLSLEAQREAKREVLLSTLEHLGGISREALEVLPTLGDARALGYRRRAVLQGDRAGLIFFGRRTHDRVLVTRCPALVSGLAELPGQVATALAPMLRELEQVSLLESAGRRAIAVKVKGAAKPKEREALDRAVRSLGFEGAVLESEKGAPELIGKPTLRAPAPHTNGKLLYLRPDAFCQANEAISAELVGSALALLEPGEKDSVLELYAGNGMFSLALAERAKQVVAVEGAGVSADLGQRAAREAGLTNLRFVQGDARKVSEGLAAEGQRFDLLLADPPRTGAPGIGTWARKLGVSRVVYVACDAAALARDAKDLVGKGFAPRRLQLVDQFPQTHHVEAVMSFSAKEPGR
jgi:23S rRNA (uracil1939-C5)-methyltransferase